MSRKFAICIFILAGAISARAIATVEPVRASQYLDYVQYEVQRRVSTTYKQSTEIVRTFSGTIHFREIFACTRDASELTSRFEIRREISHEKGERKIYEELVLTRCRDRYSVFRMIRIGDSIAPTDDAILLRGTFPTTEGARVFDLSIATGNIKFKFEQKPGRSSMFTSIVPSGDSPMQYQLDFTEQPESNGSFAQTVLVRILNGSLVVESESVGYSWRAMTGGKDVPRQYLYFNGKEIAPKEYLLLQQDLYGNGVFMLIGPALLAMFPTS